jgi:hypothetical protein
VKPAEILCRLNSQYGEETLSHASIPDWYSKFPEICKEVVNILHAHIQPTAVWDVNVCFVKELILGDRQIALYDTATNSGISVGSVESVYSVGLIHLKVVCDDGVWTSWTLSIDPFFTTFWRH